MTSATHGDAPEARPLTMTVEEVMAELRISRSMAYKLMRDGDLTFTCIGRHRRIHTASLLAFISPGNGERQPA